MGRFLWGLPSPSRLGCQNFQPCQGRKRKTTVRGKGNETVWNTLKHEGETSKKKTSAQNMESHTNKKENAPIVVDSD